MAAGDTFMFVAFVEKALDLQGTDFGATPNTIKCALIKSLANGGFDPSVSTPYPTWGASGTTNLSSSEVSAGGNYTAGGNACASPTSTVVGDVLELDWSNPATWAQDASNPTNARWAIFYDDTSGTKDCLGYMDLGADINMTSGQLQVSMGTPAFTIDCSP
jgi:hypothetical protein